MARPSVALLGTLVLISSSWTSCARERTSDLVLLDLARSLCAAPRPALQGFLASRGHQTTWLPDTVRAILDTMQPRLDSTLADYTRRGLLVDDSGMVETLARENRPARALFVSTQHLDPSAPFSGVAWIELYFGPVHPDSSTAWGRRLAGDTLFLQLQVFVVSKSAGWIVERALYDGSWLSTRNALARSLIRNMEQGRGCDIRMVGEIGADFRSALGFEHIIHIGVEIVFRDRPVVHVSLRIVTTFPAVPATPSSSRCNLSRARDRRDITVPTGTFNTFAASA